MDNLSEPFEVPSGRVARGRVTAPPSKSHAIRALVCAALADGTSTLHGLTRCDADDVQRTIVALRTLGFAIDGDRVTGHGGRIPNPEVTLDLGGSGTAFRFLTAVAALGPGPTTLTGDASLRRRPMDSIVRPLRDLGVSVKATCGPDGMTAPLTVSGGPPRGRLVEVDASESSHPMSALMLIAPALREGLVVRHMSDLVSRSYAGLTIECMNQFGAAFEAVASGIAVAPSPYRGLPEFPIDGDWSSAAYLAAAASVSMGDVTIDGVRWTLVPVLPDSQIKTVLRDFGAGVEHLEGLDFARFTGRLRQPLDVDLRDAPDLAPLVGALGCVASGTTRVRGAAHLRIKESDRIATVVAAARALGCEARELPDGFEIDGPAKHGGLVVTQHDHRIAMAFAVAGLAIPGVVIDDPACVAKSYPAFWDDLARLTSG